MTENYTPQEQRLINFLKGKNRMEKDQILYEEERRNGKKQI